LTAVKPPNRFNRPLTSSTVQVSLRVAACGSRSRYWLL
jgi:hypothetical protein